MKRVSVRQFGEFGEAAALLTVATFAIRLLPFRVLVFLMGYRDRAGSGSATASTSVRRAINRASRRLPFRTVCFQEGLAAHWMLRRRGLPSHLHYGVRQSPGKLSAHVWVELRGKVVIGEEEPGVGHLQVAVYPPTTDALSFPHRPV